jgi:hypothetical protein
MRLARVVCLSSTIDHHQRSRYEVGKAIAIEMHIVDVATGNIVEGSSTTVAAECADAQVCERMRAELERVNGSVKGVCHDRRIVFQVTRPDLPNLDFLDLPGLVAGSLRHARPN